MVYMGSKNRLAKELLPIITKYLTKDRWYVEPFCGGCNMIDKVNHEKRIAADANNYLIAMWKFLVWYKFQFPNTIKKESYSFWRNIFNKRGFNGDGNTSDEAMIGWMGFMGSFNGRFFDGGYCGNCKSREDYVREHISNIMKQKENLKGVNFLSGRYSEIEIPDNSVIYCDIPYKETKQYSVSKGFDHESFWQWCRDMTAKGNDVLVSEYRAPSDFVCVWEKQVTNSMNTNNTYKPTEKLFVHESIAGNYL